MSEAKHTPGRLTLVDIYADHEIRTADGLLLAVLDARQRANAKRLIACWNALDGIPTELIENGNNEVAANFRLCGMVMALQDERDELLTALAEILAIKFSNWSDEKMRQIARAAIAKATGSAA